MMGGAAFWRDAGRQRYPDTRAFTPLRVVLPAAGEMGAVRQDAPGVMAEAIPTAGQSSRARGTRFLPALRHGSY